MAKGYRILAKRFRTPHGEIDLIAKRRSLVAFVEVKARATLDEAAFAVTPRQQARIINAAQAWLVAHPEFAEFELRFDAILIAPRRLPRHLLAAFDASTIRRRGIAVNVTVIIPVPYSPPTASTASTATSTWPR